MSMKRTVLSTHAMLRNTLLILPLLLVATLYFLQQGIRIDSLKFGRFQVEGLYLKLDKKLVVNIQHLVIPKSKKKVDFSQLESVLDRIKSLPNYFQYISLDQVDFTDNHYRIIYKDNVIYVSSDAYEVAGMIARKGNTIEARIPLLYIKKYGAQINGVLHYNYRQDIVQMDGNYTMAGLSGTFGVIRKGIQAHFHLNSRPFHSLDPLVDLYHTDEYIREWLTKRIAAKSYRIRRLEGSVRMDGNGFKLDTLHMNGKMELRQGRVRFHPGLDVLTLGTTELDLKHNVLYLRPKDPRYRKRSLKGSTMYLTNLFGAKPSNIHLKLLADTRYDAPIVQVLKAYNITLPFHQISGTTNTALTLDFGARSGRVRIDGTAAPKGKFLAGKTTPLTFHGGKVMFDNEHATLKGLDIDTGWLRAKVSGALKLDKKHADLRVDVAHLFLGGKKNPFVSIQKREKVPVHLEWGKGWRVALPRYKTVVRGEKKGFTMLCRDIQPMLPYLRGLPFTPKSGSFRIQTSDSKHYRYFGKLRWPASYLYDKKGPITLYPFSGTYDGKSVSLTALNKRIHYNSSAGLLRLNHLYIDGKKALSSTTKSHAKRGRIRIKGTHSLIRYEKYVLLTDSFDLRVNGKSTTFVAHKDGDTVRVDINDNTIVVKARRIKAPMLRALIHFGGLTGGRYSLDLQGKIKGTMRGAITIEGGTVSSFKAYNNMIALFNTVPALTTLSDPGFSQKGFEIKTGRITFHIVRERIFFDMIYVDGKSAAISGKGTVSTRNGAIDMDLAVRTARGIGKLIGSLPVVGYILMGKDKSITTGVKVTGTLENPKVTTHMVMETLLAPFQMLIRTLKSPAHIINK